ncbi:MAG TPA: histidine phosphatase family protein [Polyangiaceae bacterium]|nr:histidine phosphatase family protein [Polyangiaceae bacterium]
MEKHSWPATLWLVRHGESAGNVARLAAEQSGALTILIEGRDVDVPLSPAGQAQARTLGKWFRAQPDHERPTVLLSSPYARARQTAAQILAASGLADAVGLSVDERLREKEFGSLNRLTRAGVAASFPEEARRRAELGKFYYRPPGGESWCDVILRSRSILDDLRLRWSGERVLIVAHQVVVLCFRYLLEGMDEATLLDIDLRADVANCGITRFDAPVDQAAGGSMQLRIYNSVEHLTDAGQQVTAVPDPAAIK